MHYKKSIIQNEGIDVDMTAFLSFDEHINELCDFTGEHLEYVDLS